VEGTGTGRIERVSKSNAIQKTGESMDSTYKKTGEDLHLSRKSVKFVLL